jgi:hypothetical protein
MSTKRTPEAARARAGQLLADAGWAPTDRKHWLDDRRDLTPGEMIKAVFRQLGLPYLAPKERPSRESKPLVLQKLALPPRATRRDVAAKLGIPPGNLKKWESLLKDMNAKEVLCTTFPEGSRRVESGGTT